MSYCQLIWLSAYFQHQLICLFACHLHLTRHNKKTCHSPKVEDRVENKFLSSWTNIFGHLKKELWTSINPKPLDLLPSFQHWELSADMHSYKAGTNWSHESALNIVWPLFFFNQPVSVSAQMWWAPALCEKRRAYF